MNIKKTKRNMNLMPYLLLFAVVVTSYIFLNSISTKVNELNYTELTSEINSGKVTELNVTPRNSSGVYEQCPEVDIQGILIPRGVREVRKAESSASPGSDASNGLRNGRTKSWPQ